MRDGGLPVDRAIAVAAGMPDAFRQAGHGHQRIELICAPGRVRGARRGLVFAGRGGVAHDEVQALVAPTAYATPRRSVVGWDSGRLAMILAVLEARCGLTLSAYDVYLNMAGGLRVMEPAADLAVAASLISAVSDEAMPRQTVVFGEIGLSGEIRPVPQSEVRLKESAKLGFESAFLPTQKKQPGSDLSLKPLSHIRDLVALFPTA